MTINEYQQLAMHTLNPHLSRKDVLINGVMGLCGEAGEAIDIVKKHLAQGHDLDREALIRELGDVAWYLAETAYALDVPLEDVLQGNIDKLKARYPQGFAPEKSLHRMDDMRIERAKPEDAEAVFALYHALIDAPCSTWSEDYPSRELVGNDVRSGKTLVMREPNVRIVAAIALLTPEDEPEYEEMAPWDPTVTRWAIPARLGVDKAHQGKGAWPGACCRRRWTPRAQRAVTACAFSSPSATRSHSAPTRSWALTSAERASAGVSAGFAIKSA